MIGMQFPLSSSSSLIFDRMAITCLSQKLAAITADAIKVSQTMNLRVTIVWLKWTHSEIMSNVHY